MEDTFRRLLSNLPLGGIRYFDQIGSTNDEALAWVDEGAADLSLVLANEQTSGRGRLERSWFTPRDSALAFSLILRPTEAERAHPALLTGLLALSLVSCLHPLGLSAAIKWPNDVLVNGKKLAGILVESSWSGQRLDAFVLGMGVNVTPASIPPTHQLLFPATSIESELGRQISREELLRDILLVALAWRQKLGTKEIIQAWEEHLAYRGQHVRVETGKHDAVLGIPLGLDAEGRLRLKSENGETVTIHFGDVHLRPLT
jgi:BirA family biotin operon repressor/biotin-[acetyl-CoA-carboxylase] ligase